MNRNGILDAIRSLAKDLGRVPGQRKFHSETGISRTELWGAGFENYGAAVEAAGLEPNRLKVAHKKSEMLSKLAVLTREIKKFPTIGDLKVARSGDSAIPSYEAYFRLGGDSYKRVPRMLLEFCRGNDDFADVVPIVEARLSSESEVKEQPAKVSRRVNGYVYLVKHGRDYKIGRSNDVARRRREIALVLPQELEHVHVIETDDPSGIERYWHERFKKRRVRGEWFRLTREDVAAFKRREYQ